MSDVGIAPIGGYFELELSDNRCLPYSGSARFQSARAAFVALLRAGKPKRVWMPRYICNAMLAPLQDEKIACVWYNVNAQFDVDGNVDIASEDWLLYVNYFGICDDNVARLLQRFPPDQIVLDYSQSFFARPEQQALATIYSPRKFFGIPDGGLLVSQVPISLPALRDKGSFGRSAHLMKRLAESPEAGYVDYQHAEESLTACEPKQMSQLTERILASIDFEVTSKKRLDNYQFLHEKLGAKNRLSLDTSRITAPLCYPFQTHDAGLRSRLISERIFVATYWPDAMDRLGEECAESIIRNLLPLPIDQRYGRSEMERIVSVVMGENT